MTAVIANDTALAVNKLLKGYPAQLVAHPNGETPDWEKHLLQELLAAKPAARMSVFRNLIAEHELKDAIQVQVFEADKFSQPVNLTGLPLTDTGNAEMFAAMFAERLRYDHRRGRWLVWSAPRWVPDADGQIKRLTIEMIRERYHLAAEIKDDKKRSDAIKFCLTSESAYRLKAVADIAAHLNPIADSGEGWDADPLLLGCSNGVLDLRTGDLRPGYPQDRITMTTDLPYQPDAPAPRWESFLAEIFDSDNDLIEFIQRAVGYSMTGDTREQCLFLCWGSGANGKSTFLSVLRTVLNDYAANTPFTTFESSRRDQATNDLAAISTARLVTASETSEASRLNEARVKAVTGSDPITARYLFSEYFTYAPMYKIWLAMNHLPTITGTDEGIWRRIRLIPFTVSFRGREDMALLDTLNGERAGILAWAVRGCLEWQRQGLNPPDAVQRATNDYRTDSDIVAQFLDETIINEPKARIKSGELYKLFTVWCDRYDYRKVNPTVFGNRITERGIAKERKSGAIWYLGIGLPVDEKFMNSD